jgi:hypothetical protein
MGYPYSSGAVRRTDFERGDLKQVRDQTAALGTVVDAAIVDLRQRMQSGRDAVATLTGDVSVVRTAITNLAADVAAARVAVAGVVADAAAARDVVAGLVTEAAQARGGFVTLNQRLASLDARIAALEASSPSP